MTELPDISTVPLQFLENARAILFASMVGSVLAAAGWRPRRYRRWLLGGTTFSVALTLYRKGYMP